MNVDGRLELFKLCCQERRLSDISALIFSDSDLALISSASQSESLTLQSLLKRNGVDRISYM
jgi:hypothetical protein